MPVREMTEADLPQVLAIQQQLGFQEWNEREFIAEIRASYALCVVFEQTNSIVAKQLLCQLTAVRLLHSQQALMKA